MEDFLIKLKYIYLPFLIISAGTIVLFSLFNLYVLDTEIIKIKENWRWLFLPAIITGAGHLLILYPRVKIMRMNTKSGKDPYSVYIILACTFTLVPMAIIQQYIQKSFGVLQEIKSPNDVERNNPGKFYHINHYYLDTANSIAKMSAHSSGKHNEYLNYTVYVATPVYEKPYTSTWHKLHYMAAPDSGLVLIDGKIASWQELRKLPKAKVQSEILYNGWDGAFLYREAGKKGAKIISTEIKSDYSYDMTNYGYKRPKVWLAWKIERQYDNSISDKLKQQYWESLVKESERKFKNETFQGIRYFQRIGYSDELIAYEDCIHTRDKWSPDGQLVYYPVYTAFAERTSHELLWAIGAFLGGQLLWLLMLIRPKLTLSYQHSRKYF